MCHNTPQICQCNPKPKKEWVGLTDEEIVEVLFELKTETMGVIRTERLARAIEAKLKEKNT
jgi:hypothetical protein